jgi:hypothetical protein
MTDLTRVAIFDANYYRLNVLSAAGYQGGDFGSFATAPLIHTYSAHLESASPRLALRQDTPAIQIGDKSYQVHQFLTVQGLNASLVSDEADDFRPTVKPHYAIAPVNSDGTVYHQPCKTLLTDNLGCVIENRALQVHVHDGLLSPAVSIANLKPQLLLAQGMEQSKFYTSYVVDDVNNQMLVTQHCLLNEMDHRLLCQTLDQMETPTLEALVAAETSINDALVRFHQPVTAEDRFIQSVFSGASPAVSPVTTSQSLTTLPAESHLEATPCPPEAAPAPAPIKAQTKIKIQTDRTNYPFLMATLAHPVTKVLGVTILMASLLLIGLVTAGLSHVPIILGSVLAAVGMFSGAAMYVGNRWAMQPDRRPSPTPMPIENYTHQASR